MPRRTMSDGYMLRLPDGMRQRIRDRAEANRRSMNAEIVHYIDRALSVENENGPVSVGALPDQEQLTHP